MNKKFIAPMTFKGGCDNQVFNTWFKEVLLPEFPAGTPLIIDNASFHKGVQTKKLIHEAKLSPAFPSYLFSYLNPIEHCWHVIMSNLRVLFLFYHKDLKLLELLSSISLDPHF